MRFLRFFIFIFFYPATLHAIEGISVYTKVHPQLSSVINLENELSIEFGVIPGAIFGQPLNSPLWLVKIDDSKSVAWPTKREKHEFLPFIAKLAKPNENSNLSIKPADTQLARISIYGYFSKTKQNVEASALSESGNYLMLVYFDRPCTLSGFVNLNNKKVKHSINIESSGFHWIEVTIGEKEDSLSVYSPHKNVVLNIGS
ncbi:hypothetical protein [Microbulbifer sp. PSTR4-B]|uniref:hypothetical protein n=1 Tax=unclassified Microbulbifer TaxID=2619833 RepID=UPI00403B2310